MQSNPTRVLAAAVLIGGIWLLPPTASAQDKPYTFNLGAGPMTPNGALGDRFGTGVTLPIGVTAELTDTVGLQFEYMYARNMKGPSTTIPGNEDDGSLTMMRVDSNHRMHSGTFNVIVGKEVSRGLGGYAIGGVGLYRRSVQLTTPTRGFVTVCDPFWFVCYPAPVSVTEVVGTRSSTDFGVNIGGGVTFGHFYAELRYHYVRGPEMTVPAQPLPGGQSGKVRATGHYLPINFGVRF